MCFLTRNHERPLILRSVLAAAALQWLLATGLDGVPVSSKVSIDANAEALSQVLPNDINVALHPEAGPERMAFILSPEGHAEQTGATKLRVLPRALPNKHVSAPMVHDNILSQQEDVTAAKLSHMRRELQLGEKAKASRQDVSMDGRDEPCNPFSVLLTNPHSAGTIADHAAGDSPCAQLDKAATPAVMHSHVVKKDPTTGEAVQVPQEEVTKSKKEVNGNEVDKYGFTWWMWTFEACAMLCCLSTVLAICWNRHHSDSKVRHVIKERKETAFKEEYARGVEQVTATHALPAASSSP